MCRPSLAVRVSHEIANGAEVSVPLRVPSTKNSTAVTMPEWSLALAAKVTLLLTVEPLAGCVTETVGGVTSGGTPPVGESVNSRRFGGPAPTTAAPPRAPRPALALTGHSGPWPPWAGAAVGVVGGKSAPAPATCGVAIDVP